MNDLGTDDILEVGSKLLTDFLRTRGRKRVKETFLWPPVYKSPFFPVFFYNGNRRYMRELPRCCDDDSHHTHGISKSAVEGRRLAQMLYSIGDELPKYSYLQHAQIDGFSSVNLPQPTYMSLLGIYSKIITNSVARRLRSFNFLTRKHGSDHNAKQEMEQCVTSERNLAEHSLSAHPHVLHPADNFRSRRDSSCLSRSHSVPSLSQTTSAENKTFTQGKFRKYRSRRKKKYKKDSYSIPSTTDSPDHMSDQPPPGALTETGMIKNQLSAADAMLVDNQDNTSLKGDSDAMREMEASGTAVNYLFTSHMPIGFLLPISSSGPGCSKTGSTCLSRSHSVPSLSQTTSAENKTFTRAQSLPDMLLKSSFEEFTPDITVDEDDETYRFQCSCPGLYQCSVTGLVFHMEGEGDVVYRTVPWNRKLLTQHHKQPAGPLFDIKCLQQSVCQLHLPHCEISSTAGGEFLSVAHVDDEGIEFIAPHKVTETHVIINISGFSAFGNIKDEDSPPDPIRALVLLFYSPPADPDPESLLNVLLLPVNVVLRDVVRTRKKLFGEEIFIQISSHCKLHPEQEYTLSTCPEDDSVLVQPTEAEFYCDNYDNYIPSFQVSLEKIMKHIKLFLRDTKSSKSVWERRVCLSSSGIKRSCGPNALNVPPNDKLLEIRSSLIEGISEPVLKSLLDKLLEKTVMTDSERESADKIQNREDKARFVIDTVRRKGEAANSEMIEFLCKVDPFLCEHLGLI